MCWYRVVETRVPAAEVENNMPEAAAQMMANVEDAAHEELPAHEVENQPAPVHG